MYRYDQYDQALVDERVAQFRDQIARWKAGDLTDDELARCACRTASTSSAMRRCSASRYPTACCHLPVACCRTRPQVRPRLRPLHDAPEHAVQLARRSRMYRRSSPNWPTGQMHAIQTSATASATSPPTSSPASPDEILDPRPLARSCASGHLPSGIRLPAAQVQDRREWRAGGPRGPGSTTSACNILKTDDGMIGLPRHRRRRSRPYADHRRSGARVPALAGHPHLQRSHPSRLQPLRPPRQRL